MQVVEESSNEELIPPQKPEDESKTVGILDESEFEKLMQLCAMENQKWKLIYRASESNFSVAEFHLKCDEIPNTLTIIKSANSNVFGGFTGTSWSSDDGFKQDPHAFIFSLTNQEDNELIIKCSDPECAIYCHSNYGPCFGNDDLKISDLSNKNMKSESSLGFTYGESMFEYGSDKAQTFLAGAQFFKTIDIEVYAKDYPPLSQVFNSVLLFHFI